MSAGKVPSLIEEGPREKDLLVDYEHHRSTQAWAGKEAKVLRTLCHLQYIREWDLVPEMEPLLKQWGLGILYHRAALLHADVSLITALVERWRWETNSFHLRVGESTITLEDVSFITGLPVYGRAVTAEGLGNVRNYWKENWFEELTAKEIEESYGKGGVKLSWFRERYAKLPEDARDRTPEVILHTKAYVFYMFGAVLFPHRSADVIHPRYLYFLRDDALMGEYAWGAGVLCRLYRSLKLAAKNGCNSIAGYLPLIQVWSYERLPIGRPIPPKNSGGVLPRAVGWAYDSRAMPNARYRMSSAPSHNLLFYRGELDMAEDDVVTWRPYRRWDVSLHWGDGDFWDWESRSRIAGYCRVPLIHFDEVEFSCTAGQGLHGDVRHIPRNPTEVCNVRGGESGRSKSQSAQKCDEWMHCWEAFNDGLGEVVVNDGDAVTTVNPYDGDEIDIGCPLYSHDEYMEWFRRKSKLRIQTPEKKRKSAYQPRSLYDHERALKLLDWSMEILQELQVSGVFPMKYEAMPDYLREYKQFMVDVKGPGYQMPEFLDVEASVARSEGRPEKRRRKVPDTLFGEEVTMTQSHPQQAGCSQADDTGPATIFGEELMKTQGHPQDARCNQPDDTGPDIFSCLEVTPVGNRVNSPQGKSKKVSKRQKLEVSRPLFKTSAHPDGKGSLKKILRADKREFLTENWFRDLRSDEEEEYFPVLHPKGLYTLERGCIQCLKNREWLNDNVVDSYMKLLWERESLLEEAGHHFPARYYFVSSTFFRYGMKKGARNLSVKQRQKFYGWYVGAGHTKPIRSPITSKTFIFFPFCNNTHWVLFVFCVGEWAVMVLDSMVDDPYSTVYKQKYSEAWATMEQVVPDMLSMTHPGTFSNRAPTFFTDLKRPHQENTHDCGVMVCKFMDFMLYECNLYEEKWTEREVLNFRFRIAHELRKYRARTMSNHYIDLRSKGK